MMTYKHIQFSDSETMRSLERVAHQKGWYPAEPLKKVASADLSVSTNLTENIVKLCSGLRTSGLEKYADEIEQRFMQYKSAQTLYETSNETGEDLVDAAHPKGSHKLENVDSSEAVIETIIDQQLAAVKMINKKPTGKLTTASQILNAVKIVLSQTETVSSLEEKLNKQMNMFRNNLTSLNAATQEELSIAISREKSYDDMIELSKNPTYADNLAKLVTLTSYLSTRLSPGRFFGVSEESWKSSIQQRVNAVLNNLSNAVRINNQLIGLKRIETKKEIGDPNDEEMDPNVNSSSQPVKERAGTDVYPDTTKLSSLIETTLSAIRGYKVAINSDPDNNPNDKARANSWLKNREDEIAIIKTNLFSIKDFTDQNSAAQSLLPKFQKIVNKLQSFQKEWIG